ncbi:NAD/NADP octopine/nopaline dehydrogenase family protein [Streptomyces collinus]|uniref:NAD/NADP octopine/nopaline dehydrogenase family protein n=1 Tax=Streptomyces collinus TaxID=42684 RepID=UPI0037B219A8
MLTTDLRAAVDGAQVVVVAVPAFAHAFISKELAAVLEPSQLVLTQPGVLGSGVEHARMFALAGRKRCLIAETPTSLYTCRLREPAHVYIGAIKNSVPLAAVPSTDTPEALAILGTYFGERYVSGGDGLSVGLFNCNPIYHVPPLVLNCKTVEDSDRRPQHTLVTPRIAEVIDALDRERLSLAHALGVEATSFWDFLTSAYGVTDGTFVERIVQGYGRQAFPEPDSVHHRYFTEDIPFRAGHLEPAGRQDRPLHAPDRLFITLSNTLCGRDFVAHGRTAESLGLLGSHVGSIRAAFGNSIAAPRIPVLAARLTVSRRRTRAARRGPGLPRPHRAH